MKKAVVVFSGGIDSVCAAVLFKIKVRTLWNFIFLWSKGQ